MSNPRFANIPTEELVAEEQTLAANVSGLLAELRQEIADRKGSMPEQTPTEAVLRIQIETEEATKPPQKPTVGRIVWFRNYPSDPPRAAIITYVYDPTTVNLCVFEFSGNNEPRSWIPFVQEGETPPGSLYCEWPHRS